MRIAHFSDLHLLSLEGVGFHRFLNKRLTGWAMLRFHRKSVHKPHAVRAVADEVGAARIDHVAITGDLTNLALESEFALVKSFLENDLGFHPDQVSVVPGNHDVYTRGAARTRRFETFFKSYMESDLPEYGVDHHGAQRRPVVNPPLALVVEKHLPGRFGLDRPRSLTPGPRGLGRGTRAGRPMGKG